MPDRLITDLIAADASGLAADLAPYLTPRATTVAYSATIAPNAATTDVLNVGVLTGNLTMAAPSGTPADGQDLLVRFQQDATGGRTISWNSIYAFGSDVTAAMIPTTANAKWEQTFSYNTTDAKWRATGILRGF